jgi:hypothetical protein
VCRPRIRTAQLAPQFSDVLLLLDVVPAAMVCHLEILRTQRCFQIGMSLQCFTEMILIFLAWVSRAFPPLFLHQGDVLQVLLLRSIARFFPLSRWWARARVQTAVARVDRHEKPKSLPKTSRIEPTFVPNVPWVLSLKVAGFAGRSEGFC